MRVQQHETDGRLIFEVAGALCGSAVAELERCWRDTPTRETRTAIVDLSGLIHVDDLGRALLRRMHLQGATFLGAKLRIKDILDELIAEAATQQSSISASPIRDVEHLDTER